MWKERLESGHYKIKIERNRNQKIDKEALRQAVTEKPEAYLKELTEQFNCTATTIFYTLEKLKMTRKKTFTCYEKSEEQRANVIGALCNGEHFGYKQTTDSEFFKRRLKHYNMIFNFLLDFKIRYDPIKKNMILIVCDGERFSVRKFPR